VIVPEPRRVRLDNGLTAVVALHDGADAAAVQLWVRVGARDEADAEGGLAHFVEHLLFKGTPTRGPGVIDRAVSSLGGEINAATGQDFTYYHVVVPARHVDTALEVVADAAMRAVFDPEQLERERLVVLEARENPASAVVAATLLVGVGSVYETAAANGVTALLGRTVLKGTRSRSGVELAQAAEDAGGGLVAATDQEYCELRAYGLARHWRRIVDLLREVAAEPSLEPEEVRREREVLAAQIRGLDDQPFAVASRLLGRALYGSHPFGLPTIGELEAVTRLGRAELLQHLVEPAVVVVGPG
jgi:predicted Zn-dependent peptidase